MRSIFKKESACLESRCDVRAVGCGRATGEQGSNPSMHAGGDSSGLR